MELYLKVASKKISIYIYTGEFIPFNYKHLQIWAIWTREYFILSGQSWLWGESSWTIDGWVYKTFRRLCNNQWTYANSMYRKGRSKQWHARKFYWMYVIEFHQRIIFLKYIIHPKPLLQICNSVPLYKMYAQNLCKSVSFLSGLWRHHNNSNDNQVSSFNSRCIK